MSSRTSSSADATATVAGARPRISAAWLILLAAAAIGLAAAFLAQRYLRAQVEEINARAQVETVPLVVASSALEKGAHLSAANVAVRPVPREWAHSNGITPEQFERLDGVVLAFPAQIGEPIVWSQLESDKTATFSARLAPGRRAVTVPIDEVGSISGMVQPGDLIDLMLTIRRGARDLAFVLQQSVLVLATGTQVEQSGTNEAAHRSFTTLTLETTPEDAKRVIAAREVGKLTALLRAPGDRAPVSEARDDAIALLGLAPPLSQSTPLVPIIYGGAPLRDLPRLPRVAAPAAASATAVTTNPNNANSANSAHSAISDAAATATPSAAASTRNASPNRSKATPPSTPAESGDSGLALNR